jgi:tetrahydromethanopterin S-methyltransferase subunit F|tara:strand:- start:1022 stop:1261 length:240 start_codon:yes stop_codon:yes gene_type:complete
MNHKELNNWRENLKQDVVELKTNLTEVQTDVKWIKESLGGLVVRQDSLTKQVAGIRAVGALCGIILGSVLAVVVNVIMR